MRESPSGGSSSFTGASRPVSRKSSSPPATRWYSGKRSSATNGIESRHGANLALPSTCSSILGYGLLLVSSIAQFPPFSDNLQGTDCATCCALASKWPKETPSILGDLCVRSVSKFTVETDINERPLTKTSSTTSGHTSLVPSLINLRCLRCGVNVFLLLALGDMSRMSLIVVAVVNGEGIYTSKRTLLSITCVVGKGREREETAIDTGLIYTHEI